MIDAQLCARTRRLARELAAGLETRQLKIVLAESCTAGLAAALLAQTPGISRFLVGSMVTYQENAKERWLGIDPGLIRRFTAVSAPVTQAMARNVLNQTEEADFAVAITGHLQHEAAPDGCHALVAVACRQAGRAECRAAIGYRLRAAGRTNRQWEAARAVLDVALAHLHFPPPGKPGGVDWLRICGGPVHFNWNHWH